MNPQSTFASFTVTVEAKVLAEAPRKDVGDPLNPCPDLLSDEELNRVAYAPV